MLTFKASLSVLQMFQYGGKQFADCWPIWIDFVINFLPLALDASPIALCRQPGAHSNSSLHSCSNRSITNIQPM